MNLRSKYTASTPVEVNVIPLLDVVFSILAFFILLSGGLVVPQRVGIDILPSTEEGAPNPNSQDAREMLVVAVSADGQLKLDGQSISEADLQRRVAAYLVEYPRNFVVLSAEDGTVSYQLTMEKLAVLRRLAGDRVAIATSRS